MKALKYISVLPVVACTMFASCSLLVSSPLPPSRPHRPYAPDKAPYENRVYNGLFEVPAEGGVYKINCADDQFYISRIFDSSMPPPQSHRHRHGRLSPSDEQIQSVNDLTYEGPFYTITCNKDEHNWIITVNPLTTTLGDPEERGVLVFMYDGSDDSDLVFLFEQSDTESLGYIQ